MMQKAVYLSISLWALTAVTPVRAVSDEEADAIVAAEAAVEAARKAERRERLLEVPAIRETVVQKGEQALIVRRVAPPSRVEETPEGDDGAVPGEEGALVHPATNGKPEIYLTLFALADGDVSRIRARDPGNGTEHIVMSDMTHLPPVLTVETPEARYTFFAIISETDAASAPVVEADLVLSSGPSGKCAIYSGGSAISESFQSAIAALYDRHCEQRAEWKAEAELAKALQDARERHRAQNPRAPRVTTINVWRPDPSPTDAPVVTDR